ncbi:MAG: RnfABCDGE type electron transport complex subunit G [Lachnospiraceae bacterium]|nr:RnfABCDGE type electron transport complex subunit G [Lachnospiraceae bacterium]
MKSMLKEAAILFAITLVSGCLLGLVYQVTKEPIAQAQESAKEEAYKEVFPDAAAFARVGWTTGTVPPSMESAEYEYKTTIDEVMAAQGADGSVLGYVITVTNHEGYGGDIQFSVGIQNDGTINGISILSISETAGLGMKADPVLKEQFPGRNVEKFSYTKTGAASDDQIDAISGATITTNAVVDGINAALNHFQAIQQDPSIAVVVENPEEGGSVNE